VADLQLPQLDRPALFDTGAWTWVRDRRFPELAAWFNAAVEAGLVLVCDLVILELTRLAPNEPRAREVTERLAAFETIPMPSGLWSRARETQLALAASGDHRRPISCLHPQPKGLVWRSSTTTATTSALPRQASFATSGWCLTELWPSAGPPIAVEQQKAPDERGLSDAAEWSRTITGVSTHKALNLARLPVPPQPLEGGRF
jgi:hypothetical protein